MWKQYYYRVLGAFLLMGGFGLIGEEFVTSGGLEFGLVQHETYGLAAIIIGFFLMIVGGKGKQK